MTEEAGGAGHERRSYPKGVRRRRQILESAIGLFAQRGVDRASLRSVGEAIGVSHTALRHYFSSRDELLVEVYRTHEALSFSDTQAAAGAAVGEMVEAAERNRSIPGLVELYATLTTDALQEEHAVTREFVRDRFRSLRETLAARIESGQRAGRIARGHRPGGRGRAGDRRVGRAADPVAARSRRRGRRALAVDPGAAAPRRPWIFRPSVILSTGRFFAWRRRPPPGWEHPGAGRRCHE